MFVLRHAMCSQLPEKIRKKEIRFSNRVDKCKKELNNAIVNFWCLSSSVGERKYLQQHISVRPSSDFSVKVGLNLNCQIFSMFIDYNYYHSPHQPLPQGSHSPSELLAGVGHCQVSSAAAHFGPTCFISSRNAISFSTAFYQHYKD